MPGRVPRAGAEGNRGLCLSVFGRGRVSELRGTALRCSCGGEATVRTGSVEVGTPSSPHGQGQESRPSSEYLFGIGPDRVVGRESRLGTTYLGNETGFEND